ncbi:hypothetical protein AAFF_G00158180 [Aldrovandia affinis]|uniref:Uncharacterized protein n=1 Tax=Aldrovandia affinis TaxID=143900 RepID=A0AAD7RNP5_9TELE|nr:hypothetical protein AAFF_G00158180 [Aldrovandia affinis]
MQTRQGRDCASTGTGGHTAASSCPPPPPTPTEIHTGAPEQRELVRSGDCSNTGVYKPRWVSLASDGRVVTGLSPALASAGWQEAETGGRGPPRDSKPAVPA